MVACLVPQVAGVTPAAGWDADEVLALAGAAESGSEHPIGRAIAEAAAEARPLAAAGGFRAAAGVGVTAEVGGRTVTVGRSDEVPPALVAARDAALAEGRTVVAVSVDGEGAGVVAVSDVMRPETPRAIAMLRDLGLRPVT